MTDKITNWTTEHVVAVLRELAANEDLPAHLVSGEIAGTDTVDTLGIDSLGGAFLIERLEELSGVLMPDDFLDLSDDVAGISARLNELVAKGA